MFLHRYVRHRTQKSKIDWRDFQNSTGNAVCDLWCHAVVVPVIEVPTEKYTADPTKSKTVLREFSATRFVICGIMLGIEVVIVPWCRNRSPTETYNTEAKKYGTISRESQLDR